MGHKDPDLKKIKELIEIMKNNNLVEIEIKHGDDKVFLKRSQPQPPVMTPVPIVGAATPPGSAGLDTSQTTQAQAVSPDAYRESLLEIKSPIVGTFYAAPSPDSDPFVELGSHVDSETVVCVIEAMKVMNEIKAETSGSIAEILVTNGQAVEYGQVLFRVRPES